MSMSFIDLAAQQRRIRDKIDAAIGRVLDHGAYIMGPEMRPVRSRVRRLRSGQACAVLRQRHRRHGAAR
jgi:dTDP-4-amino-4,6-dideoxygalactose transaminase